MGLRGDAEAFSDPDGGTPAWPPLARDSSVAGEQADTTRRARPIFAWLLGRIALTALFGFIIAITIFFVAFLRVRARLE